MHSFASAFFKYGLIVRRATIRTLGGYETASRKNKFGKPPKYVAKHFCYTKKTLDGTNYYTLQSQDNPKKHVVYLHGGAYNHNAALQHWNAIKYILKHTPCALTFIDYPLTPESQVDNTVANTIAIYKKLFKNSKQEITIMGDSSGGGLALAVAQQLVKQQFNPQPKKIILYSPWLDVSTSVGTQKQIKTCKMLDLPFLQRIGKVYAGKRAVDDPLCSPIYGNIEGLGKITIFAGSADLIYADSVRLKEKLDTKGIAHSALFYKDMQHTWMLLRMPEGKDVLKKTCAIING